MSIYVGDKKAKLYHGDYGPAQFYKGDVKIAGYTDGEKVGTSISGVDTYNDALNLTIAGKSEQTVTANSPSPDYPSPIRSSENFDVVSCGRNMVDVYKWGNAYDVVPIDNVITQTFTTGALFLNITRTPMKLKPNHTYSIVVSVLKSDSTDINGYTGLWGYDNGFDDSGRFIGPTRIVENSVSVRKFTTSPDGNFALGISGGGGMPYTLSLHVMILEGTYTAETLPPYQPYHATTAHITDTLRSVGNVSDSIEVSNGKVELVRRCATKMFDQSTPVSQNSVGNKKLFYIYIAELRWERQKYGDGLCTHCKNTYSIFPTTDYLSCAFGAWGSTMYLVYRNDTSVKEIEAYLTQQSTAGTPVTAQYQLATPTRTDITATPLGQALLAMRTYPNYTQVYTNATLPPTLRARIKEMEP